MTGYMKGLNRKISAANGLKLLGERNSGTNLLETLLRDHYDLHLYPNTPIVGGKLIPTAPGGHIPEGIAGKAAREAVGDHLHYVQLPESGGWKHAAPDERFYREFILPRDPAVLILIRHPASWLASMHRNPFHRLVHIPDDFSRFIRQPWLTLPRDGLGPRQYDTIIDMLAAKALAYDRLTIRHENSAVLRYEDLAQDPQSTLATLGLTPRAPFSSDRPAPDARPFIQPRRRWWQLRRSAQPARDYRARAAQAGWNQLADKDRDFVLERLADSPLIQLFPR